MKARQDGHEPPKVDGHIAEFKGKMYCFLASGDLAAVRRKYPTWAVYHISEVCAVMSVRTDEMMAAVTKEFAGARIVDVRAFDDEINFEPTGE